MASAVPVDSPEDITETPSATVGHLATTAESKEEPASSSKGADTDLESHPRTTPKSSSIHKVVLEDPKSLPDDVVSPLSLEHPTATAPTPVAPAPTPSKRRPNPPSKGILKPPPPPAKPSLGNRLRDIVTVVGGGAKSFFETPEESQNNANGPHTAGPSTPQAQGSGAGAVGGALNSLSGRLSLGFSRLVASASPGSPGSTPASPDVTPAGSPGPSRSLSLPDARASVEKGKRRDLKRATFLLPSLSITYPISSQGEPWSEKVLLERQKIESTHRSLLHSTTGAEYWTSQRLVALYENACKGREERPRVGIVRALEVLPKPPRTRTLHIIHRPFDPTLPPLPHPAPYTLETPLNRHAAEAFADVLSIECGLVDLRLESGALDGDDALKAILHALLVSGTLPNLSLAGNRKIKAGGWRLLGIFLKRARSLRYLDVSDTNWDRKGVEYLVQALNTPRQLSNMPPETPSKAQQVLGLRDRSKSEPPNVTHDTTPSLSDESDEDDATSIVASEADTISVYGSFIPPAPLLKSVEEDAPASLQTLRMDGCVFRSNVLEALAQGIRSSDLRNISLRRNKIGPLGAVALALMIRDYPDTAVSMTSFSPGLTASLSNSSLASLDQQLTPSPSPVPYAKYQRRPISSPLKDEAPLPSLPNTSTPTLSTPRALHSPPPRHSLPLPNSATSHTRDGSYSLNTAPVEGKLTHAELGGASIALQRSVRALDGVERIGRLLTLDLKGNEIRGGVGYIAQVLKRNRTLKVLNLSENRIDPTGLVALAESLKYNSTLETLDLSSNPCCGPTLEGVTALRTAFTVNTSLKRIFLSETSLTTEGAIALAEFLPESKSLLHIDLTSNLSVEPAGIMAISVGLKSNTLIRCLDLSIPPNAPELADLSQTILQTCIRNTELAASKSDRSELVWGPIKKSTLVKDVKRADDARAEAERLEQAVSPEGLAREYVYTLKPDHVGPVTKDTIRDLDKWYLAGKAASGTGFNAWEPGQLPQEDYLPLLERGKALQDRLVEVIQTSADDKLEDLLSLNDTLGTLVDRSNGFTPPPRLLLPSQVISPDRSLAAPSRSRSSSLTRRHMRVSSLEISSPNFSIGDSDNDSDAEELDVGTLSSSTTPRPTVTRRTSGPRPAPTPSPLDLSDVEPVEESGATVEVGLEASTPRSLEDVASPVERVSRAWVEEEGEIFRKGTRLGVVDDEEENEVSGEDLKQEILDTPVPRSPTRRLIEESEEVSEEESKTTEGDDC